MPTGISRPTSASFSPQSIRDQIRGRVVIPENLLQEALENLKGKLAAKETKFFAHQGMVGETRTVDALGIQMQAIELIAKMSELVTTQVAKPPEPKVNVIIDSKTGVMRIVIGEDDTDVIEQDVQPKAIEAKADEMSVPATQVMDATATHIDQEVGDVPDEVFESIIKVPRGKLSPELRAALFGESPAVGGA